MDHNDEDFPTVLLEVWVVGPHPCDVLVHLSTPCHGLRRREEDHAIGVDPLAAEDIESFPKQDTIQKVVMEAR